MIKIPNYLKDIIRLYPKITSGRKNYLLQHKRILKNIKLIEIYKKK